jgi:hypothetical protein
MLATHKQTNKQNQTKQRTMSMGQNSRTSLEEMADTEPASPLYVCDVFGWLVGWLVFLLICRWWWWWMGKECTCVTVCVRVGVCGRL